MAVQLKGREIALRVIADLQANIRSKAPTEYGPMNNTQEALNSLRYKWEDDHLIIYSTMPGKAFNHIMVLETGRAPGKMPPREPILQWVKSRNIQPQGITQESLAFLIQRKIGKEGTMVYRRYTATGKGTGIISDVVGDIAYYRENIEKPLLEAVTRFMQTTLTTFAT